MTTNVRNAILEIAIYSSVAALALTACDAPKTDFGSMPADFLSGNAGTAPQTLFGNMPATFLGKDAGTQSPGDDDPVIKELEKKWEQPKPFIQHLLDISWELNPFRIGTAHAEYNATTGYTTTMQSAPKTYGGISGGRRYVANGSLKTIGYIWGKFWEGVNTALNQTSTWSESYVGNMPASFLGEVKNGVGDIRAGWLGTITGKPGWVGSQFSNVTSDSGWKGPGMGN